jgi:hypothetical protein
VAVNPQSFKASGQLTHFRPDPNSHKMPLFLAPLGKIEIEPAATRLLFIDTTKVSEISEAA